jgi:cytochrome c oxidase cbb3-type subunit 1
LAVARCSPRRTTSCSALPGPAVLRPAGAFTFWGWQAVIVAAAITLPMGIHFEGVRRARMADRYPDHAGLGAYAVVFFGTIVKRKTRHIYVANWFFGATS